MHLKDYKTSKKNSISVTSRFPAIYPSFLWTRFAGSQGKMHPEEKFNCLNMLKWNDWECLLIPPASVQNATYFSETTMCFDLSKGRSTP